MEMAGGRLGRRDRQRNMGKGRHSRISRIQVMVRVFMAREQLYDSLLSILGSR